MTIVLIHIVGALAFIGGLIFISASTATCRVSQPAEIGYWLVRGGKRKKKLFNHYNIVAAYPLQSKVTESY